MGLLDGLKKLVTGSTIDKARVDELVEQGAILLDVRTAAEFADGSVPGAINIPVQELEARFVELDSTRIVVAFCRSGVRSASATTVLTRRGFVIYNAGGVDRLR